MKIIYRTVLILLSFMGISCSKGTNSATPASTKAQAAFKINYDGKTKAPVTISMTNNSKNAKSYLWDFDNGMHSTEATATVYITYYTAGIYAVTLKAIGEPGDTSTTIELVGIK